MVERIALKKLRNSEELILDMVSTPDYILKSVDWGTVPGTHHSYKYVNQVGVSITNTSLEPRPILIEGWVVARDEKQMSYLKRKLNAFVNPQETFALIYSDYTINFVPDETVKYSISVAENNEYFCKFQISGTAPYPLFSDNFETGSVFVETTPAFRFPLVMSTSLEDKGIVFGKRIASLIAKVTNNGDTPVGMKIVFKAKGAVKNPGLINVNTQEKFVINKLMPYGEEIEINTNLGEKKVRGKPANGEFTNYFMYKDVDSSWLQLEIGENLFRYTADEGIDKLDVFVSFYNRYLEVQECY